MLAACTNLTCDDGAGCSSCILVGYRCQNGTERSELYWYACVQSDRIYRTLVSRNHCQYSLLLLLRKVVDLVDHECGCHALPWVRCTHHPDQVPLRGHIAVYTSPNAPLSILLDPLYFTSWRSISHAGRGASSLGNLTQALDDMCQGSLLRLLAPLGLQFQFVYERLHRTAELREQKLLKVCTRPRTSKLDGSSHSTAHRLGLLFLCKILHLENNAKKGRSLRWIKMPHSSEKQSLSVRDSLRN